MSATVGAALKKIAVALLTNPKALKTVGGVVIGIVLILALPIIAVVSFFNGDIEFDTASLNQSIQTQLMAEHKEDLVNINKTMEKIEEELKDKELSKYNKQAEVIYIFYFYDKHSSDFIDKFVKCFKKDITATTTGLYQMEVGPTNGISNQIRLMRKWPTLSFSSPSGAKLFTVKQII